MVLSTSLATLALCAVAAHAAPATSNARRAAAGFTMKSSSTGLGTLKLHPALSAGGSSSTAETVSDVQDALYLIEIDLAGGTYVVQLDTGSADLWIYAPNDSLQLTNQSGVTTTEAYGQGVAQGEIVFGELKLGSYTIPNQAFISASSAQDFGFFDFGAVGILGLAFDDTNLSPINAALEDAFGGGTTLGRTPISNVFAQNPTTPNAFDVLLDRSSDLDTSSTGTFLIGEHAPTYADAVAAAPRLPRQAVGRWSVPLDGMAVNGAPVRFNASSVDGVPAGKLAVLLDTGFSYPPLPPPAVDAIYASIPGAVKFSDDFPQWIVPCTNATNVTFTFGGQPFPVHPLDLTVMQQTEIEVNGQPQNVTFCMNTFQYLTLDPESFSGFDAILGDAFLRNVYASFDYGDTDSSGAQAFVQLVATTDLDAAWPDFAAARAQALAALPPAIDPATLIDIVNGGTGSGDSVAGAGALPSSTTMVAKPTAVAAAAAGDDAGSKLYDLVDHYGPIVIGLLAGNILVGVLLCAIALAACLRGVVSGGGRTRTVSSTYAPVRVKDAEIYGERSSYHD